MTINLQAKKTIGMKTNPNEGKRLSRIDKNTREIHALHIVDAGAKIRKRRIRSLERKGRPGGFLCESVRRDDLLKRAAKLERGKLTLSRDDRQEVKVLDVWESDHGMSGPSRTYRPSSAGLSGAVHRSHDEGASIRLPRVLTTQ